MAVFTDVSLVSPTESPFATDLQVVHTMLVLLLNTRKGERLFRPTYGNSLEDSLFDLFDRVTAFEVMRSIQADVDSQIPLAKLDVPSSSVVPDPVRGLYALTLVLNVPGLGDRLVFTGKLTKPT